MLNRRIFLKNSSVRRRLYVGKYGFYLLGLAMITFNGQKLLIKMLHSNYLARSFSLYATFDRLAPFVLLTQQKMKAFKGVLKL